jgi:hypothetical protein
MAAPNRFYRLLAAPLVTLLWAAAIPVRKFVRTRRRLQ